ncbi:MAG TPA: hypothetical protein VL461_08750 [Dictyobacter sp.]|nr:hypothetical protein [Dictyobacter sp.]
MRKQGYFRSAASGHEIDDQSVAVAYTFLCRWFEIVLTNFDLHCCYHCRVNPVR